ncbi:MAG: tetratricopeptide repeat protein [Geobacteraceae bacterium]
MEPVTTSFWADIKKYEDTLTKDPQSYCFAPLAELYRKLGLLDDAVNVAKRGCEIHPEYVGGHMALARAHFDKGLKDEAKMAFEKVVRATPENLLAQKLLGQIYMEEGNTVAAINTLRVMLSLNPGDMESQTMLDSLSRIAETDAEQLDESPETLASVVDAGDESTVVSEPLLDEALLEEVEVIEELTEEDFAEEEFQCPEVATASPALEPGERDELLGEVKGSLATVTLADLYISQGFPKRAIAIYRELLKTEPENRELKQRLIDLKLDIDRDEANAWDQVISSVPEKISYQFQIKDAVKAARIEATKAYSQYVEEPKTSQRRGRFDLELVSEASSAADIPDSMTGQANARDPREQALDTLDRWLANIRGMR